MFPSAVEIARALTGAGRLFRRDPGGMALFDCSARGAWHSFFAAVIVAPLFIALWLLHDAGGAVTAAGERFAVVKAIGYALGWLAFPVVVHEVARLMDRADRFIPFVVAYNWAGVIQQGLYLGVGLIATVGPFAPSVAAMMTVAALAVALAYSWFVIRVALAVSGLTAAGLLGLDFMLGLLIAAAERGLLR